ncbi:hypothetical protein [Phocaeicola coprocola]|uniref:hypothetical protein n=1 Tax=Phocaeicola coprocola TaxID=310298 RepID=UPI00266F87DB|nr:hypothetical protein [Phocaeicola coprocola]
MRQLFIIDYYTEADNVYRNLQAYMELENQYQKLMASIYKNRLQNDVRISTSQKHP